MRSGIHCGLWLIGLCVAIGTASAQPRESTQLDLAALLARARPCIQEVMDLHAERLPNSKAVDASALRGLRDSALEARIRWQFPDLQGEALAQATETAGVVEHGARTAWYDPSSDTILLVPENARRMAGWDESLAGAASAAFLQLSLVHETVRVLLQQRYDLVKRQAACRDGEEFQALQAMLEGRALWITRNVARRLDTEAVFPLLTRCYLHVPDTLPDVASRAVSQESLRHRHWACVQGLAFFDYLEEHGCRDAEARVFAHPPRQVAWVKQPELYLRAQRSSRQELADALAHLAGTVAAANWTAAQQPWTPDMVCQAASLLGERPRAEKIVQGWDEGRSLIWTGKIHPNLQVAVGVVRFQDAAAARGYYNFALELQRKQDALLGTACSNSRRTVESKLESVRLRRADEAARSDKQFQFGTASKQTAVSQLWVRAGERVIEFTWQGLPGDNSWAEQALDVLLSDPAH